MEVDGVRPSSFHSHSGSSFKAPASGSLLAAVLARSRGQSARRAGPSLGSLFLFPSPSPRSGGWRGLDGEGYPPVLEPRKGAGHLALYPLSSLPWASFPTRLKDAKGEGRTGQGGEGGTPSSARQIPTWAPHLPPPPMRSSACSSSPVPQATAN